IKANRLVHCSFSQPPGFAHLAPLDLGTDLQAINPAVLLEDLDRLDGRFAVASGVGSVGVDATGLTIPPRCRMNSNTFSAKIRSGPATPASNSRSASL